MATQADLSALMAHAGWIRRLARQLVDDPQEAEELVQDTWLSALRHPPCANQPLRGWLATVMRRAKSRRRAQALARGARERRAARGGATPSTAEVLANAEVHRQLVEAVLSLEEPYRTAVLMRFFEDRKARHIARVLEVPVATVHSRLRRGLSRLRQRLDRQCGARGGWRCAVALLGWPASSGPAATVVPKGIAAMKPALKLATAGIILGAAALWATWSWETTTPSDPHLDAGPPAEIAATAQVGKQPHVAAKRAPVNAGLDGPATEPPGGERIVRGRVLDAVGRTVPGLRIRTAGGGGDRRTVSDARGEFAVEVSAGATSIVSDDPALATVLAGSAHVGQSVRTVVVVAPPAGLSGCVTDAQSGAPISGALVSVRLPMSFGADFGQLLDHSRLPDWSEMTDSEGNFALPDVPAVAAAQLQVSREGFAPSTSELLAEPARDRVVQLRRLQGRGVVLRGVVLDPRGRTVADALVSAGTDTTATNAFGQFELEWPGELDQVRLIALHPGYLPGFAELSQRDDPWHRRMLELRLGGRPLEVSGVVLNAERRPVEGARVWLTDPTYFGPYRGKPQQVESLLGKGANELWTFVTTDARGAFAIGGLRDRGYRLAALHPTTHLMHTLDDVAAGTEAVELVLPRDDAALFPRISGRVVERGRVPVRGARVRLQRIAFEVALPGGGTWDQPIVRDKVTTDDHGRFAFTRVPRVGMELGVEGDDILPTSVSLERATDLSNLVITVGRRCHLQVRLTAPGFADAVEVHDDAGRRLLLRVIRGGPSFTNRRQPIHGQESHILSVPDEGTAVLLYRDGVLVERLPLHLEPGTVNTVVR